ncbi:hypothetical protein FOZ62_000423 [Perkinsus olseni]|uniref:Ankyrin Repeat Protein n=1 Tax=Perkinsus olseni TaxID=32597 RepID=A0A7J6Q938_PEROL|nr:hypothetical protein FOZ62_000423 [Perkinsus olseni]
MIQYYYYALYSVVAEKLVSMLAKHGANAQYADKKGLTPKDIARLRNLKKIEMLLDTMDIHSKARAGDVEGVRDALLEGCEAGWIRKNHWKAAAILLEAGADVHQANGKGLTPLMMALEMNSREGVDLLIEYDADVNELSVDGVMHRRDRRADKAIVALVKYGIPVNVLCGAPKATLKTPLAALCECDEPKYKSNNEKQLC